MPHGGNSVQSKRRPWPYDAIINGVPVMLVPGEDGSLVAQQSRTLDATAPTSFEYSSANPIKERTFPWTALYGGLGEGTEPDERPRRYKYGERADLSINGRWRKGPHFHSETIHASAGEVRQLLIGPYNGTQVVWAICENGVYRRTADGAWTAHLTTGTVPALPAGQNPQQAVQYRSRVTGVDALYVTTDTGNLWEFNSTTLVFAQAVAAEGPGNAADAGEARYIEKVGDELWVAGDYWVVKNTNGADPMLRASWAGVIWVGDNSARTTWLKEINNSLYIFKTDGIYTVTEDGLDEDLFPYFRTRRSDTNGKNAAIWMDKMWIPFGDQTYILDGEGNMAPDGLVHAIDNASPVKGTAVAGAGHNDWFFYEVYYNTVTGLTHLIKHGTWIEGASIEKLQTGDFAQVHHGSLAQWSKQATCAAVLPGLQASGNDRLYVGFADGTVEWCVLPKESPNPSQDANCEFTQTDSYVYLPTHHMGFEADNKLYLGITMPAENLSTTEFASVEYKLDLNPLADWVTLEDETLSTYTVPGQRIDFPVEGATYSKQIILRVKLSKDPSLAASPYNLSPIVDGVAVHQAVRPSLALEYVANIKASSYLPKHNGTVDRRRGHHIKDQILTTAADPGIVLVTFPDGDAQEVMMTDYKESWASYHKRHDLDYVIRLEMIQYRTISHNRVFSGLTYATLEQYTVGELESII